jgi:uncharacterized protein with HEPN domain
MTRPHLDIVWETASVGIPDLAVKIQALLEDNL